MSAQLAPVALDASVIRNILALDSRLRALGPDATLAQWLEVPPIVVDIDERIAPHPVEDVFEREAGALRTVCFKPHSRLRTVEEVQQASRVRDVIEPDRKSVV